MRVVVSRLSILAAALLSYSAGYWESINYNAGEIGVSADLETVKAMVTDQPLVVNSVDNKGRTPLQRAAFHVQKDVVSLLIAHGANVNAKDRVGITVLGYALDIFCWGFHDGGAPRDPVVEANRRDIVQLLLAGGAEVNAPSTTDEETPLHTAAAHGDKAMVEILLGRHADVKTNTSFGETPLHCAAQCLTVVPTEKAKNEAWAPAARQDRFDIAELLLRQGADIEARTGRGETPLHCAAEMGNIEVVRSLLAHGAEVNAKNGEGETPLHLVAQTTHLATSVGKKAVAVFLLDHGADVNAKNKKGETPLHYACDGDGAVNGGPSNDIETVLLDHRANVNVADASGDTAMFLVATRGRKETAERLIAHGANLEMRNKDGYTALCWAAFTKRVDVAESLLEHHADANARNNAGQTPLEVTRSEQRNPKGRALRVLLRKYGGH